MAAGFCLEFYLVDYARLRNGDPESMQSMKIHIINFSSTPNFTYIQVMSLLVSIKRSLIREHVKASLKDNYYR